MLSLAISARGAVMLPRTAKVARGKLVGACMLLAIWAQFLLLLTASCIKLRTALRNLKIRVP